MSIATTHQNLSDSELVSASIAGDRQSFGTIVQRYQGLVTGVIYNRCQGNIARSEELAQDTFVAAWQSLSSLQDTSRLGSWLCGIAKNIVNSATRNDSARETVELSNDAESVESDPLDVAITREREELLWQALEEIPEKYREPMIMFYRQEKQAAEVAEALDINEPTVRKRLERGRAMLKDQVAAMVEDTLSGSAPNAVFTAAVIAALPTMTAKTAAAATGGGIAIGAAGTKLGGVLAFFVAPLMGFVGGIFGAWNSYRQARSKKERIFIVKMTVFIFLLVGVFMITQLNVHHLRPYVTKTQMGLIIVGSWLVYGILLTLVARYCNRRHRTIRESDGTGIDPAEHNSPWSNPLVVRLSLAGGCFGGVSWILAMSSQAGDWVSFVVTMIATTILYIWASRKVVKEGSASARKILIITMCVTLLFAGIAVNLKFNEWLMAASDFYTNGEQIASPAPLWIMNLLLVAIGVLMLGPILVSKDIEAKK